jgi:hypothetical protein
MTVGKSAAAAIALTCLIGLSWPDEAKALQLRMTIPADDTQYLDVIVSADERGAQKITYRDNNGEAIGTWNDADWQSKYAMLSFPISSIPNSVTLKTCAIRLVVSENTAVPEENKNPTLLRLLANPSGNFKDFDQKAIAQVKLGTEKGLPLVFSSASLCDVIKSKRDETSGTEKAVRFFLSTSMRNRAVAVYMRSTDSNPSLRPRLVLAYSPSEALLADADWTQIRHDAQHSGRSAWKMHDNPAGNFSDFKANPLGAQGLVSLYQSPLLYGGMLVAAKATSIVALDQMGNQLTQSKEKDQYHLNKYLAAGPNGLLYDATGKSSEDDAKGIEALDLSRSFASSDPEGGTAIADESLVNVPTIGSAGSFFTVTSSFVHAYSSPPKARELWRYPTGQRNVSAVTLSEDEGTAYVLFGPGTGQQVGQNRIVALDAATGACRWSSKEGIAIVLQSNGTMPNPVVAGLDIYFRNEFPRGDKLYAFRDKDTMLEPSEPQNCDQRGPPGGKKTYDGAGPTPVAGRGKEAIFLKQGQLCWARELGDAVCSDVTDCKKEELNEIMLMIGDNSDKPDPMRFYGIDQSIDQKNRQLFAIKAKYLDEVENQPKRLDATCRSATEEKLGPNLILGLDGTLYNYSDKGELLAITPSSDPKSNKGGTLTLTSDMVGMTKQDCTKKDAKRGPYNRTAFLSEKIETASDLCLPPGTDIILSAANTIGFRSGFTVTAGARLRAKVGIVQ